MTTATPLRAAGIGAAAALLALTLVASPAQAATCVRVPTSTPGTNLTIAGDDYRVPAVSGISVCAGDGAVPQVDVERSGGSCSTACLAVVARGSDVYSGGLTISYRIDGDETSHAVDPGSVPGTGDSCLLGVGFPEAPRSDCLFAVEPDDDVIGHVEERLCALLERTGQYTCPPD